MLGRLINRSGERHGRRVVGDRADRVRRRRRVERGAHRRVRLGGGAVRRPVPPLLVSRARLGRATRRRRHLRAARASSVSRRSAVMVGWMYRPAIVVFVIGFAWIEFVDVTTYLNHYWFMTTLGLVMIVPRWTPGSLSAPRRDRSVAVGCGWCGSTWPSSTCSPGSPSSTATGCCTRCHCGSGSRPRSDLPLVGPFLEQRWTAYALSWAGAAFDCSVVALLLWRRTRVWAWVAVVAFHVATWLLFPIGVFPWLMIGVTTIFFAARLAAIASRRRCDCGEVDRIPWRPVRRSCTAESDSERGACWPPRCGCW